MISSLDIILFTAMPVCCWYFKDPHPNLFQKRLLTRETKQPYNPDFIQGCINCNGDAIPDELICMQCFTRK